MSSTNRFSIIAALTDSARGIGYKNSIPWKYPADMKFFKSITTNTPSKDKFNAVIMGRKTWESLPQKHRPLSNRKNIVVSGSIERGEYSFTKDSPQQHTQSTTHMNPLNFVYYANSLEEALDYSHANLFKRFVIGGETLYKQAITLDNCESLYLTHIDDTKEPIQCDTFFPQVPTHFKYGGAWSKLDTPELSMVRYDNWSHRESQENDYLNLLRHIVENGEHKTDRTGTGTRSVFGRQLRFSLADAHPGRELPTRLYLKEPGPPSIIPLITTKKVYWKGVVEELLFFLRGDHDNRKLQAKNVRIWDGNTTREYLDKYGKTHIDTNDLGLAYGVQWRAAGASLGKIDESYIGKGIDQLKQLIHMIKTDPYSRRLIINAWNVPQLDDMALVPCHMMYQFHVSHKGELSCMMTQRSCDMFLGVPFNIASTALLTHIIAKVCNLTPHEIIINLGDAHIYGNHIEQAQTQLQRQPLYFPVCGIHRELETVEDIEKLQFSDFELYEYHSWPAIKAQMAV